MFNCVYLNKNSIPDFNYLNNNRQYFNVLNEDFYGYWNTGNFVSRFFLCRKVKVLKCQNSAIGYIWSSKCRYNNEVVIRSMYVNSPENLVFAYKQLIDSCDKNVTLIYSCEKKGNNYEILNILGFEKKSGIYEMKKVIDNPTNISIKDDIKMCVAKGKLHAENRCRIQNEVFKSDSRIPLTVDDIYFDEVQSYYLRDGSILIEKNGQYIGYGQIIIINDDIPTIVNVGILKEMRGRGYGKALMNCLLKILFEKGFKQVTLKVDADNVEALSLYESLGFRIIKEIYTWKLKR